MENAFRGHVDIDHFRQNEADQRQENTLGDFAHPVVFGGWSSHEGGGVYGIMAAGDGGYVKHRVGLGEGVVASVIPERTLSPFLAGNDVPLQHDLGVCRHFQIHRHRLRQFDSFVANEAGQHHLIDVRRQGRRPRPDGRRISAESDRHLQLLRAGPVMARTHLVGLPVHAGRVPVEHLHPIDAVVLGACFGVPGDHQGESDIRAGIHRPALDDRQTVEIDILSGQDDLLTRWVGDGPGLVGANMNQPSQGTELVQHSLGWSTLDHFDHGFQAAGQGVGVFDLKRPTHAPFGAEQVDSHGRVVADHVLEQERRPIAAQ